MGHLVIFDRSIAGIYPKISPVRGSGARATAAGKAGGIEMQGTIPLEFPIATGGEA
jgi:hypothetical protein